MTRSRKWFRVGVVAIALMATGGPTAHGQPRPGKAWLGVVLDVDNKPGVPIQRIYPGSPAEAAGLKVGEPRSARSRASGRKVYSLQARRLPQWIRFT